MSRYIWRGVALGAAVLVTAGTLALTSGTAGAAKPLARAVLLDANGVEVGEVVFKGEGTYAHRVEVEIDAPGAPNLGKYHGFHVHAIGSCVAPGFTSAGGHWNPGGGGHGDHAGDLPSVLLGADGTAYAEFETDRFNVTSLLDAGNDGSAVILHYDRDNFGNIPGRYEAAGVPGPDGPTLNTGDAGLRYACGEVTEV